jgi:hypothetical protein
MKEYTYDLFSLFTLWSYYCFDIDKNCTFVSKYMIAICSLTVNASIKMFVNEYEPSSLLRLSVLL